jgi:hypothetical protein
LGTEVHNLKEGLKSRLSGRDKALVYGSFLTMLGLVIVEIIKAI